MTFIATANVAEIVGARPVFIDIDRETLIMAPEAVRCALTPNTRAIIRFISMASARAACSGCASLGCGNH
jgi:UDP-4-amino-4-deoxy-L-arabinose-oxoglutarate aminotransferase